MSVNVALEVNANAEDIDKLKSTLKSILPDTRNYDGCLDVRVTENQDDPLNIILFETWESRSKYEKYLGWRDETGALKALGEMLSQPPSIRYFDNLDI